MTTPLWAGPYDVALVLLAGASVLKLWRPSQTVGALRAVGLPASAAMVRAGAAVEVGVCGLGVAGTRVGAALVAASFLGFAAFVAVALARHSPVGSCGCFGGVDTPPSSIHVVIDVGLAAASGMAATAPVSLGQALAGQPWAGVPFLALTLASAWLAFVALTDLPRTLALSKGNGR